MNINLERTKKNIGWIIYLDELEMHGTYCTVTTDAIIFDNYVAY